VNGKISVGYNANYWKRLEPQAMDLNYKRIEMATGMIVNGDSTGIQAVFFCFNSTITATQICPPRFKIYVSLRGRAALVPTEQLNANNE
jgi:hypothetical protein